MNEPGPWTTKPDLARKDLSVDAGRYVNETPYIQRPGWNKKQRPMGKLAGNRTHGTRSTYNAGCGCEECLAAERIYSRERKRRQRNSYMRYQPRST